jgi:hypothetical protein
MIMSDFKERELSKEFIRSVLTDIFETFKKTQYYEEYDKKYGEVSYSYEISCKNNFLKYIYPLIAIDKHNANFDGFNIEFIHNYNYIDTFKEEEFLVIIEDKERGIDKINSGIKIKKIMKEIDLNQIFYKKERNKGE